MFSSVLEKEINNFVGINKDNVSLGKVGNKFAITVDGMVDSCYVSESYLYNNESERDSDFELVLKTI
jgi:hypothetical protein